MTGHVEGSCMGTNILIAPKNQVRNVPNKSPNCYSGVHSF